ncbi:glycosyltransferase family 2 protein [Ideonella sp. DXS22W]|uniref:Glycosyltransferase family 2 protein n=1 Tax=Pseudaquabacterium inlustre TaxID=2984192 RepID=A0ABU9CGL4_9BURK
MISLNEGHNLDAVLGNLAGWAQEVWLVDSYSTDATIDIALRHGIRVVQRRFRGFGDQWNFALSLPVSAPWTMKLDPDERLSDELKQAIVTATATSSDAAFSMRRHLHFLGRRLPVAHDILRLWRTGTCRFSDVPVNEHPLVDSPVHLLSGVLDHHDSPNLHHWFVKQNRYTTSEAAWQFSRSALSVEPKLLGTALQRRMWLKKHFWRFPLRYVLLFAYHYLYLGAWRCGQAGYYWSQLRTLVYRQWEMKAFEMRLQGAPYAAIPESPGLPDPRIQQFD